MKSQNIFHLLAVAAVILLIPAANHGQSAKSDSFYVANWNLENLFDTNDDPDKDDDEFLPGKSKDWNFGRFETKLNHLACVINYMNRGCGPDIISFEEVENIDVMKRLIYTIGDRDYVACHRDSPDERGIDVGLLYDRNVFTIDSLAALHVEIPEDKPTRDILHVVLVHKNSKEKIHVYVNHWPSRRGGEEESEPNRIAAANVLKSSLDTLNRTAPNSHVIILGDFNDNPVNKSITEVLGAAWYDCKESTVPKTEFVNLAYKAYENGEGSYLYDSKFDMIDQMLLSKNLMNESKVRYICGSFEIIKPPFMVYQEGTRKGGAIPTYAGYPYVGGYSDHFPIGAKFCVKYK